MNDQPSACADTARATVFGGGGPGGNVVAQVLRRPGCGMKIVCAHTDVQALQDVPHANRLQRTAPAAPASASIPVAIAPAGQLALPLEHTPPRAMLPHDLQRLTISRSAVTPSLADRLYGIVRHIKRRWHGRPAIRPATPAKAPAVFHVLKAFDPPRRATHPPLGARGVIAFEAPFTERA